jgi:uncharacterized protein YndB with AHSA1/START domain
MHQHVERSVDIPASPSDVWKAMSDPERLGDWLGGATDLRPIPGTEFTFIDGSGARHGHVIEVVPQTLLRFWWASEDREGSVVAIDIEPAADAVRVWIRETPATISGNDHRPSRQSIGFQPPTFAEAVR